MVEASVAGGQIALPASTMNYKLKEEEMEEAKEKEARKGEKTGVDRRVRGEFTPSPLSSFQLLFDIPV